MIWDLLGDIGTGFIIRLAFCDYIKIAILKGFEIILLYKWAVLHIWSIVGKPIQFLSK